jgi:hypothetical protein
MSNTAIESRPRISPVWMARFFKDLKSTIPSRTAFYSYEAEAEAAAEASRSMDYEGAVRVEICRGVLKNPPPFGARYFLD